MLLHEPCHVVRCLLDQVTDDQYTRNDM